MSKRKTRILFIGHEASATGAPFILYYIIKWLKENSDFECALLLLKGGVILEKYEQLSIPVLLKDELPVNLAGFLADFDADLIYGNTVLSAPLMYEMALIKKTATLLHIHELELSIEMLIGLERYRQFSTQIDVTIGAGKNVSQLLDKYQSKPSINIPEFVPCSEILAKIKAESKSKWIPEGISNGDQIVLGCGTGSWRKGIDLFLRIAQIASKKMERLKFIWVGYVTPEEMSLINYEMDKMCIQDLVHFAGFQENVFPYFKRADVFLLTSREDPFPLVCLEAACGKLPIICFDKGNGISSFAEYDAAIVVEYLNVNAMAEKTIEVLQNKKKYAPLVDRAFKLVTEKYDVAVAMKRIEKEISILTKTSQRKGLIPHKSTDGLTFSEVVTNQKKAADELVKSEKQKHNQNEQAQSLLLPLEEINIQLFWGASDMAFSEERSGYQSVHLDNNGQSVAFRLPEEAINVYFLRFDLSDKIGLVNIHEIRIKNATGDVIWIWDQYSIVFKNELLLIENETLWPGKTVQFSTSGDPHFILNVNEVFGGQQSVSTVELVVSRLDAHQMEVFNRSSAPLSYISSRDHALISGNVSVLHTEKNNLLAELSTAQEKSGAINGENLFHRQNITVHDSAIRQLGEQLASLNRDKLLLTEEIGLKNQLLESYSKESLIHSQNITAYDDSIRHLHADKVNLEADKLFLTNEITAQNGMLSKISAEKENHEFESAKKEKQIQELSETISGLKTELNKKVNLIVEFQTEKKHMLDQLEKHIQDSEKLSILLSQTASRLKTEEALHASHTSIFENQLKQLSEQRASMELRLVDTAERAGKASAEREAVVMKNNELLQDKTRVEENLLKETQKTGTLTSELKYREEQLQTQKGEMNTLIEQQHTKESAWNELKKDTEQTMAELNHVILHYKTNFDNKNIFQIGWDRFFKKKKSN